MNALLSYALASMSGVFFVIGLAVLFGGKERREQ